MFRYITEPDSNQFQYKIKYKLQYEFYKDVLWGAENVRKF